MASWSREGASPDTGNTNREFDISDLASLYEALYPVSTKYKSFGLQIGLNIKKIEDIEESYGDVSDCVFLKFCMHVY